MLVLYYSILFIVLYLFGSIWGRDIHINCTSQCSFQMSFDDELQRSSKCIKQTIANRCIAQVTILYHIRQISVNFRTTGLESNENEFTLYAIQQVSHIFNSNYTSYTIIFVCFFADDCDWLYIHNIINRFINIDYTFMFNEFKSLLYDSSNKGVSQCYSQNKIIDCNNGICSSLISQDNSHVNRSCVYLPDFNVGIDVRRYRIFSDLSEENQNYVSYFCNQNFCNNPSIENSIQTMVDSYTSLFDILQPSKTVSIFNNSSNYLLLIILLLLYIIL